MTHPDWPPQFSRCGVCDTVPGFFGMRMLTGDLLCIKCWGWAWEIGLSHLTVLNGFRQTSSRGYALLHLL